MAERNKIEVTGGRVYRVDAVQLNGPGKVELYTIWNVEACFHYVKNRWDIRFLELTEESRHGEFTIDKAIRTKEGKYVVPRVTFMGMKGSMTILDELPEDEGSVLICRVFDHKKLAVLRARGLI